MGMETGNGDWDEQVVKSVEQLAPNQVITVHYADGTIQAQVQSIQKKEK